MASCRRHLPFYEHLSLTVGFEKSAEQNRPEPPDGSGSSFRERSSKDPAAHWYSIDPRPKQQGVTRIYASRPTVL